MPEARPLAWEGRQAGRLAGTGRLRWAAHMARATAMRAWSGDGRAGRRPGLRQLWQVPVFVAGLAAVILVGTFRPFRPDSCAHQVENHLAVLRQTLDDPKGRADEVLAFAENYLARVAQHPGRAGE